MVFSLAELDSGILDSDIIVADTMNGESLAAKQGPFRIVAPHEKRPARWVRMLKSITVVRASRSRMMGVHRTGNALPAQHIQLGESLNHG